MRRLLSLTLAMALVVTGTAFAARGDPQKEITPADQARAKSMLLRKSDVSPAFASGPTSSGGSDFYCAALDESDLTLTGEAESPTFAGGLEFVTSTAYVYTSKADSDASWRRGTSAAGQKCLREGLRREVRGSSVRLISFKKVAFPKLAQRSVLYRAVADREGVRIYLDLVALQHSRAQVAVVYGAGLSPPPAAEERRLARLTAARMAKAMRR
ncbi:MAG: hypothetical protein ACRDOF_10320 [Gaiellaceae bacterium]